MGERPGGHTLDRVDNSKGYSKDNCRWATPKQQAANRRQRADAYIVEAFGESRTLVDWVARTGIAYYTIDRRLKAGWPPEKALSVSVKGRHRKH